MFEEPIRFFEDVIRNNRSVLDLLYGNYTFVNPVLAKHYGIPGVTGTNDDWVRVDDAGKYERGGLLPMAVFLTQSSPGSENQSSQARVLGGAPALGRGDSSSATKGSGVAAGRSQDGCAIARRAGTSIARIRCAPDAMRALTCSDWRWKGTDPWARPERRTWPAAPSTRQPPSPATVQGSGFRGVQAYIKEKRQQDFLENISRKLLSYSLSRTLQLSDDPVVAQMKTRMSANGYRFGSLVETIVSSQQFLNRRRPESTQLHSAH